MAEINLKTEYPGVKDTKFTLSNGDVITIHKNDIDFLEKLQKLSIEARIKLMLLTDDDLVNHINARIVSAKTVLEGMVKTKTWHFRDTDEPVVFFRGFYGELFAGSDSDLKKRLRSKKPLPLKTMYDLIDFYAGKNSEFYTK